MTLIPAKYNDVLIAKSGKAAPTRCDRGIEAHSEQCPAYEVHALKKLAGEVSHIVN